VRTIEWAERLPVTYDVEVLVVGGGPAGFAAALAARRLGAEVLLVEQFNCLGGIATAGGHNHVCQFSSWCTQERVVGGVPFEVVQRVADAGYGVHDNSNADFELEGMKLVLEEMAERAGLALLYHTLCADALVEQGAVTGAVIQNKGGRQVVRARRVVDCSGDADVAARAGCGFDMGDEEGRCQPVTLMFTIGGVDHDRVLQFRREEPDLDKVWKRAQDSGDMQPFQSRLMGWWWTPTRPDQLGVNFTHVNFIDSTSAEDLTAATLEARKQAFESIEVYRKYVPGMEQCYMVSTPSTIGVRESRRVHGDYTLTREDLIAESSFEDSVGYGSFFIDIHNVAGPGMDELSYHPEPGFKYQIPYRVMVPRDVENLLVAGRCVSCTHEALGSLRVMPQCGVMGQAAGTAAALSLQADVPPRGVDVGELQRSLREQGCIVDQADVDRANASEAMPAESS
jgi:hypothetical protein